MTTKSRLALLSSLAATPAFAAPFLAIGDNAELYLTARTEARYEDNITFAPEMTGVEIYEDVSFEFVPGVQVLFGKNSLTSGSFTAFERFIHYTDHTRFNEELANLIFKSTYDGAKLRVVSDASFRELNQNSRDENAQGRLVRRDVTMLGVAGELAVTEKSKVGLAGRYAKTDYKTAGFADRETYVVPVNYYFAITPKVDLSAGVQYTKNEIDELPTTTISQDSDQLYYNVGARGEFTAKLSGSFSVGYSVRETDAGDEDGMLGLYAGLVYLYSPKTQLTLDIRNDFDSGSGGGGQETSSVKVGARSMITPGLTATVNLGYEKIDYLGAGVNRDDDYFTALAGLTYTVNQYVSLDAYYNYLENSSNVAGAEFRANIVTLAANFRY